MFGLVVDEGSVLGFSEALRNSSGELSAITVVDLGAAVSAAAPGADVVTEYASLTESLMLLLKEASAGIVEFSDAVGAFIDDIRHTENSIAADIDTLCAKISAQS